MAIDNRLQVFNEEGQSVDYDILASDVKFLPDGKDLPTKLAEMEAHQGDGTVKGVKMNNGSPIEPDGDGVVDLGTVITQHQDISGKVDKETGKSLMSADEHTKLEGIEAGAEKNIIKGIKANGASSNLPVDQNGVVELPPAGSTISPATAAPSMDGTASVGSSDKYAREDHVHPHDTTKLSQSDISVETQGDGTVDINVGSGANKDTYTINLNHTHEDMATIEVDDVENLPVPAEMEDDTIYGGLENGEISVIYLKGHPFYGGVVIDTGEPQILTPIHNTTLDMGTNSGNGFSKALRIRGRNLSNANALTVSVSGSGYALSFGQSVGQTSIQISAAQAALGADVIITCSNGTDDEAEGVLVINSNDLSSPVSVDLIARNTFLTELPAVKLTGTQWLQTDWNLTSGTDVVIKLKFTANARSWDSTEKNYYFLTTQYDGAASAQHPQYYIYALEPASGSDNVRVGFLIGTGSANAMQTITQAQFVTDKSTFSLLHTGAVSFTPGENGTPINYSAGSAVMAKNLPVEIGRIFYQSSSKEVIFDKFDLTIYEITIKENGTPVRHYVPMDYKGTPGLECTLTGHFMSSKVEGAPLDV